MMVLSTLAKSHLYLQMAIYDADIKLKTMNNENPITAPWGLVEKFLVEKPENEHTYIYLATRFARWGWDKRGAAIEKELQEARDQELNECCEWLKEAKNHGLGYECGRSLANKYRATRRPKQPGQAEKALEQLDLIEGRLLDHGVTPAGCIRTALERLRQLEEGGQ